MSHPHPSTESSPPENPYALFEKWFHEAKEKEHSYPDAMTLASVAADGRPAVRVVLMRKYGNSGFEFFTNYNSAKGQALIAHPFAEGNFYWKSTQKQIRISGPVVKTSATESDEYFQNRPHGSKIGAWASEQSAPMTDYNDLEKRLAEFEAQFKGREDIPRPPHWGGFRINPERIEFWHEQPFRLHKRFVYIRENDGWRVEWLFP